MNKKEAAQYLNLSTRALERAVERGKVHVTYKKDRYGRVAVYDRSEIRRYKSQIENPPPQRRSDNPPEPVFPNTPHPVIPVTVPGGSNELIFGRVVSLMDDSANVSPSVPVAEKLTLTLAEAAALSGLPEEFLGQSIRDKKLRSFELDGTERIKRADLDSFIKNL